MKPAAAARTSVNYLALQMLQREGAFASELLATQEDFVKRRN
jgi:hypothetical protein